MLNRQDGLIKIKTQFVITLVSIVLGGALFHMPAEWQQDLAQQTDKVLSQIQDVMWEQAFEMAGENAPPPETVSRKDRSPQAHFWPRFLDMDYWRARQEESAAKAEVAKGQEVAAADAEGNTQDSAASVEGSATSLSATECPTETENARSLAPVFPVLVNVQENQEGTFTAFFGYENKNDFAVCIPIGSENRFEPAPEDRGQPTAFQAGAGSSDAKGRDTESIFSVVFKGGMLKWTLMGQAASAIVFD